MQHNITYTRAVYCYIQYSRFQKLLILALYTTFIKNIKYDCFSTDFLGG